MILESSCTFKSGAKRLSQDCGKHIEVFGKSHLAEVAAVYKLPILGQIPMTPAIAAASDAGDVESLDVDWFDKAIEAIVDATKE